MRWQLLLILLLFSSLYAYEKSMANLYVPTGLEKNQGEFSILHRFYGDVTDNPLDTFFGIDTGANVSINARYQLIDRLEFKLNYQRRQSEKKVGISYKGAIEDFPVYGQLDIHYFTYDEPNQEDETAHNFEYTLSLQNEQLWDRLVCTANIGYDAYMKRFLSAIGVSLQLSESIELIGEYYPVFDRESAEDRLQRYIGEYDSYLLGLCLQTYGHRFIFTFSNSDDIGIRRTSLGTDSGSGVKFGFNLQRRLEF